MGRTRSQERSREEFLRSASELHDRLWTWRQGATEASFDEIMERMGQEREEMMRPLAEELVGAASEVEERCPECGGRGQNKGKKKKVILHRKGAVELKRNHYYCPSCKQGFFPPGSETGVEETGMESEDAADGVAPGG